MDEFAPRRLPAAPEAEQAVLGAMMLNESCVADVVTLLRAEDFYVQDNREIFEAMHSMFSYSRTIDPLTLINTLQERGTYHGDRTRDYIRQLWDMTPSARNALHYAGIVRDKALLRQIATASSEISEIVYSGEGEAEKILDQAEQKIYEIRQGRADQSFATVGSVLLDVYERLNELARNGGKLPGIPTGFSSLDRLIYGLNQTDLILIASRPGMGKTSFALNIALNAAKSEKKTVAFFSLEMSRDQLVTRLLSSQSLIDSQKLMTGSLDDRDWEDVFAASEILNRTDIRIDDNPMITPAAMKAKCLRLSNLGLIVIDYLQLMTTGGRRNENRVQEVSELSRSLKIMAKDLKVPVICLSQLSRANEKRENKRPMLSDLRESGSIEQDADIIMFLYREGYYDRDNPSNSAECIVAKNRHGATGTIDMQWLPQYTSYAELDLRHDE